MVPAVAPQTESPRVSWPARCAIALIHAYRLVASPWLGGQCRFYPTCSHYAEEAIARHGVGRGVWLALQRLSRCHPFHAGGVDPVPESEARS